jgi:hypothetical protein
MDQLIKKLSTLSGLTQYETDGKFTEIKKFAEMLVNDVLFEVADEVKNHLDWDMAGEINYSVKKRLGLITE